MNKQLQSSHYGRDYYQEHREAGLDYTHCGDWQLEYGRWLAACFRHRGHRVLDVGCACGGNLRGIVAAGFDGVGIDLSQFMIDLGRITWPDMSPRLFVCDAVNLHLFDDGEFDWLHSAQVAEHWRPDLVPLILRELWRVTKPGGLFFCALDTTELFARQSREMVNEDPTHICVRPMVWWNSLLVDSGWVVASEKHRDVLFAMHNSYLQKYDWDWFVAEKPK